MRVWGGVDPGRDGFLVLVNEAGQIVSRSRMPWRPGGLDRAGLAAVLAAPGWSEAGMVLVEHQQPFGREGVKAIWTAAFNYGVLLATLDACGLKVQTIPPAVWKRRIGLETVGKPEIPEGASKADRARVKKEFTERRKGLAIEMARTRVPGETFEIKRTPRSAANPHSGFAEATLLALLARDMDGKEASA